MATKSEKSFGSYTECSICQDTYKDPKCLPCEHTFCMKCLEKLQSCGSEISCPCCRRKYQFSAKELSELQDDVYAREMALNEDVKQSTLPRCGECKRGEIATVYCDDCTQAMCGACTEHHGKATATRWHNALTCLSTDPGDKNVFLKNRKSWCGIHEGKILELYCKKCREPICVLCSHVEEHEGHKTGDLPVSSQACRQQLIKGKDRLAIHALKNDERLLSLKQYENDMSEQVNLNKQKCIARSEELKRLVEEESDRVISQFQAFKEQMSAKIHQKKRAVQKQSDILNAFKAIVEEFTSCGSDCDVVRSLDIVNDRIHALDTSQREFINGGFNPDKVSFSPANIDDIRDGSTKLIGWVIVNDKGCGQPQLTRKQLEFEWRKATQQAAGLERELQSVTAGKTKLLQDYDDLNKKYSELQANNASLEKQVGDLHIKQSETLKDQVKERIKYDNLQKALYEAESKVKEGRLDAKCQLKTPDIVGATLEDQLVEKRENSKCLKDQLQRSDRELDETKQSLNRVRNEHASGKMRSENYVLDLENQVRRLKAELKTNTESLNTPLWSAKETPQQCRSRNDKTAASKLSVVRSVSTYFLPLSEYDCALEKPSEREISGWEESKESRLASIGSMYEDEATKTNVEEEEQYMQQKQDDGADRSLEKEEQNAVRNKDSDQLISEAIDESRGDDAVSEKPLFDINKVDSQVMKRLLNWLDKQDWAEEYFDGKDAFNISVFGIDVEDARAQLKESGFIMESLPIALNPTQDGKCSYDPCMNNADVNTRGPVASPTDDVNKNKWQMTPGCQIYTQTRNSALFSGKIRSTPADRGRGLTVSHLFQDGDSAQAKVYVDCFCASDNDSGNKLHPVATCRNLIKGTIATNEEEDKITADIALLNMDESVSQVQNVIWLEGKYRPVDLSQNIAAGTDVVYLDQSGKERFGKIQHASFTKKGKDLYKTIHITSNDGAKAQPGDCGALVVQRPQDDLREAVAEARSEQREADRATAPAPPLPVFGVVLGNFESDARPGSAAIVANRLSDVFTTWTGGGRPPDFAVDFIPADQRHLEASLRIDEPIEEGQKPCRGCCKQ